MIKTQIAFLIENDYMERDKNKRGNYIYLP
jgi:hypothetical protein